MARRGFVVLALAAGTLVPALALEAGLRVYHAAAGTYAVDERVAGIVRDGTWAPSDDPELVYVQRPSATWGPGRDSDSHGILRPTETSLDKPPHVLRAVVLGDSVTAAITLPYEQRFTTLCERRLQTELGRPVELLNFAVDGYDTGQEARLLETTAGAFSPDLVVLVWCMNDPAVTISPLSWFRPPQAPTSHAAEFLRRVVHGATDPRTGRAIGPRDGPTDAAAASTWRRMYDADGPSWRFALASLDRVAAWSRAHDVPVLVVVAPLLQPDDPHGATTDSFRRQVVDASVARGLLAADLQDVCARRPIEELRLMQGDVWHFSPAGHEEIAAALLPGLRDLLVAAARRSAGH